MRCRIVYKPDKTVAIIYHVPKSKLSEQEAFDKAVIHGGFVGLPYEDTDSSQLPQSREYRNAWEGEKGKPITINQDKVQQIDRERAIQSKQKELLRQMAINALEGK